MISPNLTVMKLEMIMSNPFDLHGHSIETEKCTQYQQNQTGKTNNQLRHCQEIILGEKLLKLVGNIKSQS